MDLSDLVSQRERLPIGKDDYKKIIDENCVYIDKTLVIKEFWRNKSEVTLLARPRRFGKSITLSMMRYFFEKNEQSKAYLFENTKIWKEEGFKELQGKYPVIHISFKDIKATTWEEAYLELKELLAKEVKRTLEPLFNEMDEDYKDRYQSLINETASRVKFNSSLFFITEVFKKHFKENTIILIDEYDAPIVHAYVHGFFKEMTDFMRQLFSKALKGNTNLHKGVMTGVVRTAKDGILSGLNNPDIYTMLDAGYSDRFGFTEDEIDGLLTMMGLSSKKEELKSWYNGYVIGVKHGSSTKIYNPWSVLRYIKNDCIPETYWANTGSPELLEKLIAESGEETQREFLLLLEGNSLQNKQINQDVILLDLDKENIEPWSFLFFAGYLTAEGHLFKENEHYYTLKTPNKELAQLYRKLVVNAIGKTFSSNKLKELLEALLEGNLYLVNKLLEEFMQSMCSFHDLSQDHLERSLHMFVLGLLASLSERYVIRYNLESGVGRYDIAMYPKKASDVAVIIEFKKGKDLKLEKLADQALKQIKSNKYESSLKDFGYKGKVLCYGIATFKKHLVAKMEIISME
ncbi:MAG: AAA family ATPase [Verrucomicrobia bacterium]|nr:AAA family ATPase [Verrucomicrobiota bacterium]